MADFYFWTLPMPVVASVGETVTLKTILEQSFGGTPADIKDFWVAYYGSYDLQAGDYDYWNPASPTLDRWKSNGYDYGSGFNNRIHLNDYALESETLTIGNVIGPMAFLTVPVTGTTSGWSAYIEYHVMTIDPDLMMKGAGVKAPTAQNIVDQVYRFAAKYGTPVNSNDCHFIAAAVAASAGATFSAFINTQNVVDPSQNMEHGFWRIAYRGSDAKQAANWQSLVKPGDIVRMGWTNGGFHTATILSVSADKQTIKVYDNTNTGGTIGIHEVNFNAITKPGSITIYRLTTDNYYLERGSDRAETIPGSIFNDKIFGEGGADKLFGAKGNDWLDGGTGADTMTGGIGNDTYYVDNIGDAIVEAGGQGSDKVLTAISYTLGADAEIEGLAALKAISTGALTLIGNRFAQTITGNAGKNTLKGMGGGDTLKGLGGNDTYHIASSRDVVVEAKGGGSDKVLTAVSYTLSADAEIETFSARSSTSKAGLSLTGNGFAQTITGNAGTNTLKGMGGNDVLSGGLGGDTLSGGSGDDRFMFDTLLGSTNIDVITDFHNVKGDNDRFQLDPDIFKSLKGHMLETNFHASTAGVAKEKNDYIVYDTDSGKLFYDADGSGSGKAVQLALLKGMPALSAVDFFVL